MLDINEKQERILKFLQSHPDGATANDLADLLSVTKTAGKEHIDRLSYLGLLNFRDEKGLIGRPKRFYMISSQGTESISRQYVWFTNMMLDELSNKLNADEVASLMSSIALKVAASLAPKLNGATNLELVEGVTEAMNGLGYRAKCSENKTTSTFTIEAVNCVYHNIAKVHPALCKFDISLLKSSTKLDVTQESCIVRGDVSCRFCLKAKPSI